MTQKLPQGLVVFKLEPEAPLALREKVRQFCLEMIAFVYGYGYRPDWHADLDSLLDPETSPYFTRQRGAFFVVQNQEGAIVGTAGLRGLFTRPDIIEKSGGRYPIPEKVASHWRMYVHPHYRKQGLGQYLIDLRKKEAVNMGYEVIYFHCNKSAEKLRHYWEQNGFSCFMEDEMSAHYDGPLLMKVSENKSHTTSEGRVDTNKFWQTLHHLTTHLNHWHPEQNEVPDHLCHQCQNLCQLLKETYAQSVCADPRNAGRVRAVREAYADTWSSIYSRLEFKVAEELWLKALTYESFKDLTNKHPLFLNADDVAEAEIALLKGHGINLAKARVCMIGPGAIPNTALAFLAAGAHVSVVDCFEPACTWANKWFGRFYEPHRFQVIQGWAEEQDFNGYDVVIVAAMLFNRGKVIQRLETSKPGYVLLRTTANRRPMSMLMPQSLEQDLSDFQAAQYVAETNPPLQVGNFTLLYRY